MTKRVTEREQSIMGTIFFIFKVNTVEKVLRDLFQLPNLDCQTLNIETLRYCRPKVSRDRRFCPFCPESVESEEHFLLECKKYDSLRMSNKFISETLHVLGKGVETIKHILNPQNQQNSKNITNYINDALKVRKCSISK